MFKMRSVVTGFLWIWIVGTLTAHSAVPSVPRQISFQAKVTNAGGSPVSDGMHSASFALYGYRSGGTEIWSQGAVMVTTAGGLFSYNLGSGTELPLTLSDADSLWLEITFEGEVQSPRLQMVSSPSANVADGLEVRSPNGEFTVISTDRANGDLIMGDPNTGNDKVKLGAAGGQAGRLRLNGFATGYVQLEASGPFFTGPELEMRTGNGSQSAVLTPDNDGSLTFTRGDGITGAFIAGGGFGGQLALNNSAGTGTIVLDGGVTGNNAVKVPTGSISAVECLEEPGVASIFEGGGYYQLTGNPDLIAGQLINAPAAGFVLAIGTCVANVTAGGTEPSAGISFYIASEEFVPSEEMVELYVPSTAVMYANNWDIPITVQAVVPVTAGEHAFWLVAEETSGTCRVHLRQLSLLFIPSAYGTVDPPAPGAESESMESAFQGVRAADSPVSAESPSRAEFEEMRAQIARLEAMLNEQRSVVKPELGIINRAE